MLLTSLSALAAIVAITLGYKKWKPKSKKAIQVGDTVIVSKEYSQQYKDLPTYGLNVTELDEEYATVLYMHQKNNEICTSKVLRAALKVVNAKRE